MLEYRVEMAIHGPTGPEWKDCGKIGGRSSGRILRRAFYKNFRSIFEHHPHDLDSMQVFHSKYHDMPIMRLVRIKRWRPEVSG